MYTACVRPQERENRVTREAGFSFPAPIERISGVFSTAYLVGSVFLALWSVSGVLFRHFYAFQVILDGLFAHPLVAYWGFIVKVGKMQVKMDDSFRHLCVSLLAFSITVCYVLERFFVLLPYSCPGRRRLVLLPCIAFAALHCHIQCISR